MIIILGITMWEYIITYTCVGHVLTYQILASSPGPSLYAGRREGQGDEAKYVCTRLDLMVTYIICIRCRGIS